jgi:hypothetical protein
MYDYNNGRFLSVDPFIQAPTSTQSLNPYTYIFNNPLSGIDPTGYQAEPLELKIEKVQRFTPTGSHIQSGVTVSGTTSNGNSFSATFVGGNLESVSGVDFATSKGSSTNAATNLSGTGDQTSIPKKTQTTGNEESSIIDKVVKGYNNTTAAIKHIANNPEIIDNSITMAARQITAATDGVINGDAVVDITGAGDIVRAAATGGNQLIEGNIKAAAITVLVVAVESKTKAVASIRKATHKKVDYSSVKSPKNVGEGKNFTLKQKQEALELNKKSNGGVVKSDLGGQTLVKPKKSKKGVTPDPNEWQFDHIQPKSCGGKNCSSNLQILSRKQNRTKSNN